MTRSLARLRARLSYANVTATLALFVALGGTSYAAATLGRNTVGSTQIRSNAVGSSEIRSSAVGSSEIRDRTIALRDLAVSTRSSLRGGVGPAGPAGPAGATGPAGTGLTAAVNSGGAKVGGNARDNVNHPGGSNEYTVEFTRDVSTCIYAATLAAASNGGATEQPPAGGRVGVASAGGASVLVKTYDGTGAPAPAPFHLLVSC
ncbi:hypothetical protein OM076_38870 [Solirubrobacter ginsenosidimutans]|uniref:Collagen-like protein n=1 Tax=Solirubrobacter ginsenosidimutans TaxID=490573 RepID=A0A9X3N3B3_9ACTN|nr:hypothetical protein [Solirubrobacter ginsenosidimutans]MDA0166293.1 hypothetical protein [Solirubrobacter ginsenosidimutans]